MDCHVRVHQQGRDLRSFLTLLLSSSLTTSTLCFVDCAYRRSVEQAWRGRLEHGCSWVERAYSREHAGLPLRRSVVHVVTLEARPR